MSHVRSRRLSQDPSLLRLADATLIPPFPGTAPPDWLLAALEGGLAGVTLFGGNLAGSGQIAQLTERLRSVACEPVIAIDEEGGDVTRLAQMTGSPYPGNAALGAVDDPLLTQRVYHAIGADLAAVGINLDFAPSVDVNTAADNPVIGTRAFGADPDLVSRHAAAAVTGIQATGVAACAKHFPGHGSTHEDTHDVLATVQGEIETLCRRDVPPFQAAIAAGVKGVMTGHLRVRGLTGDLPATLSHPALTGLLREKLGFRGVIVTDALEMRAVRGIDGCHSMPECAVLAMAAGADLLCLGRDQDEQMYRAVRAALADAVAAGRLAADRLDEAATRVRELREFLAAARSRAVRSNGSARDSAPSGAFSGSVNPRGTIPDDAVGLVAARRAARLFRAPSAGTGIPQAPPCRACGAAGPPAESAERPLVVQVEPPANIAVGTVPWGLGPWLDESEILEVHLLGAAGAAVADAAAAALRRACGRALIVVVRGAHRHPAARELITALLAARPDTVVVEMGLPIWRPEAGTYLATYGAGLVNSQVAAEILGLDHGDGRDRSGSG